MAIDGKEELGFILNPKRSRRYPVEVITDLDYADDIALIYHEIAQAKKLLNRVKSEAAKNGLYWNAKKTKMMRFKENSIIEIKSISGGSIEEVDNFKYLGGWMKCCQHDVKARKAQAWMACQKLKKIWNSSMSREIKIRLFLVTVKSMLLYNSEKWTLTSALTKSLDGAYTSMLRMAPNISWKQRVTNEELYSDLPKLSCKIRERRLRLAVYCVRHREEIASKLVLWQPLV